MSRLSDNEFKVSLGVLKNKTLIELKNGKLSINASKEILARKMPEEKFLEALPIEEEKLDDEQKHIFSVLQKRKQIVKTDEQSSVNFELTSAGREIAGKKLNQTCWKR